MARYWRSRLQKCSWNGLFCIGCDKLPSSFCVKKLNVSLGPKSGSGDIAIFYQVMWSRVLDGVLLSDLFWMNPQFQNESLPNPIKLPCKFKPASRLLVPPGRSKEFKHGDARIPRGIKPRFEVQSKIRLGHCFRINFTCFDDDRHIGWSFIFIVWFLSHGLNACRGSCLVDCCMSMRLGFWNSSCISMALKKAAQAGF